MDNNFEYRVYLKSLSKQFPTIADAATEIINLQAILSLPKGTEHFLTDIHGEYEQFNHVLKNGSGSVRRKIDEEFGNTLSVKDKKKPCDADLLSSGKAGAGLSGGRGSGCAGGLVQDHDSPAGADDQTRFFQIYPLQGAQGAAPRFFLCHRRADYRKRRNSGQRALL